MRRWVSSKSYGAAIQTIVDARKNAGLTQRQLAERMNKPASFVAKIETGERRLDIVEFVAWARALGQDASALTRNVDAALGEDIEF